MTPGQDHKTPICVLGGGPAGAAISRRLAMLGHRVTLIEGTRFPRHHVGEALPAPVLGLLDAFQMRQAVEEAEVYRARRALVRWPEATPQCRTQQGVPGLQVDRGRFDRLMLDGAEAVGVRVVQPARALKPRRLAPKRWEVRYRCGGENRRLEARFLIDATGRRGLTSDSRHRDSPATTALYGYWRGGTPSGRDTLIDVLPDGWLWGAMIPNLGFNAMVFMDEAQCRGQRHAVRRQLYLEAVARSALFRDLLQGGSPGPVRVSDATAFHCPDPVGPDHLKVGEAAYALDPLSSQGVLAALTGALHGSLVANTLLGDGGDPAAALAFYRARQEEAVRRNRRAAARSYGEQTVFPGTPFWQRRARQASAMSEPIPGANPRTLCLDRVLRLSRDITVATTPVVEGEVIASRPALHHPDWDRPIAFLNDVPLGEISSRLATGISGRELLHHWSQTRDPDQCKSALAWLWAHGAITE